MPLLLELFVMLVLANGAPVIAAKALGSRWAWPIDGGCLWFDGRPLLGASKTWRGLVAGAVSCALFSYWAGLGPVFGVLYGLLGLSGDLLSSFIKRRCGFESSTRALGLDQIPEAALPVVLAVFWLPLSGWAALLLVALFAASNILLSPVLFRLGIRNQPH